MKNLEGAKCLYFNRYNRLLSVGKWFNSLLIYSVVLLGLSLSTNICFAFSNELYISYEKNVSGVFCILFLGVYLFLILQGFYSHLSTRICIVLLSVGVISWILQTVILFCLISENILDSELQQQMISRDYFKNLDLLQKVNLGIDLINGNAYLQWLFLSSGILTFLLILCPAYAFQLFHRSGLREAFIKYLKLRKIAYEQ